MADATGQKQTLTPLYLNMKRLVEIKVKNIYVSKEGWYSFDFFLRQDGKLKEWGNLDGTFSQRSREAFRQVLKRGYAADLVIQRYY